MAIVQPGTGEAPVIEDGLYEVTCIDLEELEMADEYSNGELRPKVKVRLQVHGTDDGDGNDVVLDPLMNLKWSAGGKYPASTLFTYATAFCGPQDGNFPFDTDDLMDKKAQALIQTEPGKWPKVTQIVALKKNGAKAPAKATTADDLPWEDAPMPTILNEKGEVDFDAFWKAVRGAGISRTEVIAEVNGDIENLMTMEPTQVPILLEHVIAKYA